MHLRKSELGTELKNTFKILQPNRKYVVRNKPITSLTVKQVLK